MIQGYYDGGGSLKVVNALPCPKGHTPLPWNQQGVKGDKGDTGATGAAGETRGTRGGGAARGLLRRPDPQF